MIYQNTHEGAEAGPVISTESVLAIDPGRSKCGIAVVAKDGSTLYQEVVSTERLESAAVSVVEQFPVSAVVVGNGTNSAAVLSALSSWRLPIQRVDEQYTSEDARRRYLDQNPPTGIKRLVPRFMRYPDQPYDDHVAVLLGERWWRNHG